MIINKSQGNIDIPNDIKEYKIAIDPKNLNFITTLLTSNLYSNPEKSFIREIVSNAWDSHVEANTTDVPVIVSICKNAQTNSYKVSVRDYGVGLSPERFKEIFCNIGSSTKRDSNEYIGGFGIGRFSSLACSNSVYITSYYNGTAYQYLMLKSGNAITTTLISSLATEEKNGVSVSIVGIKEDRPFVDALEGIAFFPNVYLNMPERSYREMCFNNAKIIKKKYFSMSSQEVAARILLGNVLYPIDTNYVKKEHLHFISIIRNTGVVINFNIGELCITPNRESIIYTKDTIDIINTRIAEAKEEFYEEIYKIYNKDYDNIFEYLDRIDKDIMYNPFDKTSYSIIIPIASLPDLKVLYKGQCLYKYKHFIRQLCNTRIPTYKCIVTEDQIVENRIPWQYRKCDTLSGANKILCIETNKSLTPRIKNFLKCNYQNYTICHEFNIDTLKKYLNYSELVRANTSYIDSSTADYICEEIYKAYKNKITCINLDTNSEYLKYIEELKKNSPSKKTPLIKDVVLWRWDRSCIHRRAVRYNTLTNAIADLQREKCGIVLAPMDMEDALLKICPLKKLRIVQVSKNVFNALKEKNLSFIVDYNYILYKDPMLATFKTISKYFPSGFSYYEKINFGKTLPKDLRTIFERIDNIANKILNLGEYRCYFLKDNVPLNSYTEYYCKLLTRYLTNYRKAYDIVMTTKEFNEILLIGTLIKTKAYRVDYALYQKYKNNPLIKLLCKK